MDIVKQALAQYGASLTEQGHITRGGKVLPVLPVIKGKRLRFESGQGTLLASGPVSAQFVESFVEKFWYWSKE